MSELSSMTVNERLFAMELVPAWDAAVSNNDRAELISLQGQTELSDQAERMADSILKRNA